MLSRLLFRQPALLLVILMFSFSASAELVVVLHPDNNSQLTAKNIERIFLGKEKKFPDGKETLPINQAAGSQSRETFDQQVLGRNSTQVAAYWSKLVFTGKGIPPKEVADGTAVIDIVAKNLNAIGYVDASQATGAVRVVPIN